MKMFINCIFVYFYAIVSIDIYIWVFPRCMFFFKLQSTLFEFLKVLNKLPIIIIMMMIIVDYP